ncbi:MAG: 3-phosphoshikimate 1-carboxyvinyltransferase [Lachnospiraceae bacterium]|nr:3-phosphoshikimate 1-carboxyvinyltransferase [Lachnospiraceae bacterium]
MDIRLKKGTSTVTTVRAISSKSYVHRLLIASALSRDPVCIGTNILSMDMEATVRSLNALGAHISIENRDDGGAVLCVNRPLQRVENAVIDCGESGSTARFILPLAAYFADRAVLTGTGKLPQRPMGPLCDVLRAAGSRVENDFLPVTTEGRPCAGDYEIAGNVSSQFITGLMFLLPLLDGPSSLKITGDLESAAYVEMTKDVLGRFSVDYDREGNIYRTNRQEYAFESHRGAAEVIDAEGDWSNAAYVMAIIALMPENFPDGATIEGLDPNSIQGDRAFADILGRFGVKVSIRDDGKGLCGYTVKGRPESAVTADCTQIPDLVPALSVLAAYADGDSVFENVGRLRIKECDRVEAVKDMLGAVSVKVDIISHNDREDMIVHGRGKAGFCKKEIEINSFNDHRIAMAATALAAAEDAFVVIRGAQAVRKSYPGFYETVGKLGIDAKYL